MMRIRLKWSVRTLDDGVVAGPVGLPELCREVHVAQGRAVLEGGGRGLGWEGERFVQYEVFVVE